jgi:hypothetical protein
MRRWAWPARCRGCRAAGRLRRYYRLTRGGRHALAEEAELRAARARVVRARLGLAGGEAAG